MAGAFTGEGEVRLWRPGVHTHDIRVKRVAIAVKEYDEGLNLARHELTGDWVVIIGENGYPVFGFGTELPSPADVGPMLARHDTKRHGQRMLDALAKEASAKRQVSEARMSDMHYVLAERYEFARRQELSGRRMAGGRARNGDNLYQRGQNLGAGKRGAFPTVAV